MQDFEEDNTVNTVCIVVPKVVDKKIRVEPIFRGLSDFFKRYASRLPNCEG